MATTFSASDFELAKENVLPLRHGREADALFKATISDRAKRELFAAQQAEHLDRIRVAVGTELHLEAWCEYIAWARQALVTGGRKGELAVILNDCVKHCSDRRDDYRYVKVCVEFSEHCKSPLEFLSWMEHNGVGMRFALFWEAKARLQEEVVRDTTAAAAALNEGLRMLAQPAERLRTKLAELHARVAAKAKTAPPPSAAPEDDENGAAGRRVAFGARPGVTSASTTTTATTTTAGRRVAKARPSQLVVYSGADDEDGGGGGVDGPSAVPGREWIDYGSERQAVKENTAVAKQWSRATIPQQAAAPAGLTSRPAFAIFDDDDAGEGDVAAVTVAAAAAAPSFRPQDTVPKAAAVAPAAAKPVPAAAAAVSSKGLPSPVARKNVRTGFREAMLQGETLTFEEVRAGLWLAASRAEEAKREQRRQAEEQAELARAQQDLQRVLRGNSLKQQQQQPPPPQQRMMPDSSFAVDSTLDTMNYEAIVRSAAKTGALELVDDLRNVYADTIDFRHAAKGAAPPPTVNTRAVMDEVERMFQDDPSLDASSVLGLSRSLHVTAAAKQALPLQAVSAAAAAAVPFEIYDDDEEDSLESFRATMNASAALAGATVQAPPPAAARVVDDSVVSNPWQAGLAKLTPARVAELPGFVDHGAAAPRFEDGGKYFWLGEAVYDLSLQIGGGVDSCVYRAEDVSGGDDEAATVVKIFKPARAWEFAVVATLHQRVAKEQRRHLPRLVSYHQFAGQSMLLTAFCEGGTAAAIRDAWQPLGGMPEELALFLASELLRAVEALHAAGVLHNDISPDNVLLVPHDAASASSRQCVLLVDYSCALLLTDFAPLAVFRGATGARCALPCPAAAAGGSWTFEQDYYGIAAVLHAVAIGTPLSGVTPAPCKAGWQQRALWDDVFATLLQAPSVPVGRHAESAAMLKKLRLRLESHILQTSNLVQKALAKQTVLLFELKK